jgi:hypothetical protein
MASPVAASGRIKQILREKRELRAARDTPIKSDHGNTKGARDGTNKWLTVKIKMVGTSKFNRTSMQHVSLERKTTILECIEPVDELPAYLKESPPFGECLLPRFVLPSYQMHSNNGAQLVISKLMMIRVICAETFAACCAAQTCCDAATVLTRARQRLDNQMTFRPHLVVGPCV